MASSVVREADWRTDISCETRLELNEFACTWTLHNFSLRRETAVQAIESPHFSTKGPGNSTWCLKLYPKGCNYGESKDFVALYVCDAANNYNGNYRIEYKFAVIDEEGQKANLQEATSCFRRCGIWGFARFIEKDDLLTGTGRLLPNDKLTVYCEVLSFVDYGNLSKQNTPGEIQVPGWRLSQDFGHLLASRRFSDVVLSVEGKDIHAHKNILAARSPVFAAMFEHDMKGEEQGRVEITDCSFEVFREVVEFIYTGGAPKLHQMVEQVLVAASKYNLWRLKAMCEDILCQKLSVRTAAEILVCADIHNAQQLKAKAIDFIKVHAAGVMETGGWKEMATRKPHLVRKVLTALAVQKVGPFSSFGNL
ncbi:hypothetical protein HPB48_016384 [Haemaphysalis longicornis]|uniref:Speckle-type POZ protein n=1 Tax=Haemaphysalis longicornis TaxID=44386 RepID=A0A9J6FCU8_HAELO|nr:hypothetical protein HPB48_016384 [Haemaphysalis longicornis]